MDHTNEQRKARSALWISGAVRIGLVLVMVALTVGTVMPPAAQAQGDLHIAIAPAPYLIYDHNKPPADSPGMFMAEAEVCNAGDAPLDDIVVYIGDGTTPGAFPENTGYTCSFGDPVNPFTECRLVLLDEYLRPGTPPTVPADRGDATRDLHLSLLPEQCEYVYWPLAYPISNTGDLDGMELSFYVWGTVAEVPTVPVLSTAQLQDTLSASPNKIQPTSYTLSPSQPDPAGWLPGEEVTVCYTAPYFGTIGEGPKPVGPNDLWFQPIGLPSEFDPDVWQLVGTTAKLYSTKCLPEEQPYLYPDGYRDTTYFGHIDGGNWDGDWQYPPPEAPPDIEACAANSQSISGEYCYTFVGLAYGDSALKPYQVASSGNQEKYNNDYGPTTDINVRDDCTLFLSKYADKDDVGLGHYLEFTVEYRNDGVNPVGSVPEKTLQIYDTIRRDDFNFYTYYTDSEYDPASCTDTEDNPVGTIHYSTDDGQTYSDIAPSNLADVTDLMCAFEGVVPANSAPGDPQGQLVYTVLVTANGGFDAPKATSNFDNGLDKCQSETVTTTPVTLSYFQATGGGDRVRFEWSTATETGNVGFNLYTVGHNGRQQINGQMIPSHVVDSFEPQDYVYEAAGVAGDRFFIEDVDIRGRTRKHGPFALGEAYGARVVLEPIDWAAIRAEHGAKTAARSLQAAAQVNKTLAEGSPEAAAPPKGQEKRAAEAALAPAAINLLVDRDGLYRLTYEALLAADFDLDGTKASDLALTNGGTPVPIYVESGAKFGPGAYLEFYGEAVDTLYTDTNVYTLLVDRKLAQRVAVDDTSPDPGAPLAGFYMETAMVENNRVYANNSPNGDPWFDARFSAYDGPVQKTFDLPVDNYVGEVAPSTLSVGVWGLTIYPRRPDHHLTAEVNGEVVADEWFDNRVDHPFTAPLPAGLLQQGANTLTLRLPHDTGAASDLVRLDRYGVTYPRAFVARGGGLAFDAVGERFQVNGLPTADVVVYRQDGGGMAQLAQVQVGGAEGAFSATFAGSGAPATYLVSTAQTLFSPGLEAGRALTDITSGTADYVIIAHPDFIEGLAGLVADREAQGYAVRLVDVEDIYAQFSHGILDAGAIRDYVAHAAANMGAQYFLLVGGDTYDYHDYLGDGAISFIPSLYAETSDLVFFAPVDPLYTDLNQDGVPDRAIGRFPVRTSAELEAMVSKTRAYGGKEDYRRTAVFAADAADGSRSFTQDSESFIGQLPGDWGIDRAHMDDGGLLAAQGTLTKAINRGVALTTFVGHSASTVWSFDGLFTVGDAVNLTNVGLPTLVAQYGCYNNWYVATGYDTLAHSFLVSGPQGAAAVLGPTALADASSEAALGRLVTSRLAQPGMTVGAAVQGAKAELAGTAAGTPDVLLGWILLGDPTLVVEP